MKFCKSLAILLLPLLTSGVAHAQLPQARLDRIFPMGGEVGSSVLVTIEGKDLDDANSLHFDHPGLKAEPLKPREFRVTIGPDVPPGSYDLRAVGAYGISGGRLFSVARGLAEVLETEPNDAPEKAQAIPLNAAINGRSDGNGDDFFRFPARKGQRVLVDCLAFRLDSTLRAAIVVSSPDGKILARSKPYFDRTDPLIDLEVPEDGEFLIGLHDATYSGGHPYRLIVASRPQLEAASPIAVVPGETVELTLFGRNLPGGKRASGLDVLGMPLEQVTVPFNVPNVPVAERGFSMIDGLPSPSLNARGFQALPPGFEEALEPLTLLAADSPVTREQEPNDAASSAQRVQPPTFVSGRLDRPGDADWFAIQARQGETFTVDLYCERIDRPGDLHVVVVDDKGSELANVDDHGITFNALAMHNRDPLGKFTAPQAGTYRLLVQDTYNNGGPRYLYALRIARPEPDFYPVVVHETRTDPSCPVVRQGGSAYLDFCLNRRDGFGGPVTVEAEGLPAGVDCPPIHVSPQSDFSQVVFSAREDAPSWAGPIRLKAWATIEGRRVERIVRCSQKRWAVANISTSRACREICLAVRPRAPYGLKTQAGPATVAAGSNLDLKVTVARYWPEFRGKIQVSGLDLPPGFGVATVDLPEGQNEVGVTLKVAGNVPPGPYTIVLRGDAQVPFSPDPKSANKRPVRVADPATPLSVVVTPAPKK